MPTEGTTNRPRRSRLRRVVARIALALAVVLGIAFALYAVLAVRFYSHSPRLARNFAAELNSPLLAIPEEERAWPIYRAILLKRREIPAEFWISEEYINSELPREETEAAKLHELNHHLLADVREASKIPRLGFLLRDEIDPADYAWYNPFGLERGIVPDPASENPPLIAILIPHVSELREFARQLSVEGIEAAQADDGSLAVDDVLAMLRIAEQLRETPLLVTEVASWKILENVLGLSSRLLSEYAGQVDDSDIQRLAEALESFSGGGRILPQWRGDRLTHEDIVQRIYSDDGMGDGYLQVSSIDSIAAGRTKKLSWRSRLADPIVTLRYAKRAEAMSVFNAYMDASERECQLPFWKWDPRESEQMWRDIHEDRTRLAAIALWIPNTRKSYRLAEFLTQKRDALLAAIALERFRRERGSWPQSLAELVPGHLSEIPIDRFDGRPLRYRVIDGHPLLYSVGADRDDDHGLGHSAAGTWLTDPDGNSPMDVPNGDWILWPPPDDDLRSVPED